MVVPNRRLAELQEKFRVFYNQNLGSQFVELEAMRLKYLHFFWKWIIFFVVLGGIMFWVADSGMIPNEVLNSDIAEYVILGYFVTAFFVLCQPFDNYKSDTKKMVMEKVVKFFGDFDYRCGREVSSSILKKSGLFGFFDKHVADDSFAGFYNGVKIEVYEEKLTREVRTNKGRYDKKVFKGIVIVLDMNKKFSGQTIVYYDWGIFNFMRFVPKYKNRDEEIKMPRVVLEDCIFEKEFEVFSTDQVEARYVLTTAFMERILAVKQRFHGKKVQFSFFDNQLVIAIQTGKDMFETTALFTTTARYGKMREVVSQFEAIFSAIDALKLGQK